MSNFFRVQKTKKVKRKSYLKPIDNTYGVPNDPKKLSKWFAKQEKKIRYINKW